VKPLAKANPTNKVHFACFDCRTSFKQPGSSNWDPSIPERPFECPNCKQPMTRLGRYFKAPPRRSAAQWHKVELLVLFGESFFAGNSGLGTKCKTVASTVQYLVDSGHVESDVRKRLRQIRDERRKNARGG
jgi:hypothetical protein